MPKTNALVMDDSRVMRQMIMKTLGETQLAEFEFTEAEDGVDGLSKLSGSSVDIVFVDWNMPKMTGVEMVRKVRGAAQISSSGPDSCSSYLMNPCRNSAPERHASILLKVSGAYDGWNNS